MRPAASMGKSLLVLALVLGLASVALAPVMAQNNTTEGNDSSNATNNTTKKAAPRAEEPDPAMDKGSWTIFIVIGLSLAGFWVIYAMNKGSPPPRIQR